MKKLENDEMIVGKVIKIIDEYNIVVNLGSEFVMVGDKLNIYEIASSVIDPDTNEILGTIDLVKAKVYVKEVKDRFSICYSDEKEKSSMFGALSVFSPTTLPLNVNTEQNESLLVKDKTISIGDTVKVYQQYIPEDESIDYEDNQ